MTPQLVQHLSAATMALDEYIESLAAFLFLLAGAMIGFLDSSLACSGAAELDSLASSSFKIRFAGALEDTSVLNFTSATDRNNDD